MRYDFTSEDAGLLISGLEPLPPFLIDRRLPRQRQASMPFCLLLPPVTMSSQEA